MTKRFFWANFIKYGRKIFHSNGAFFSRCLPTAFSMFVHVSEHEFFWQLAATLPSNATEKLRFLKTFKFRFFWKNRLVFEKTWIFSKLLKVAFFLKNAYQMLFFLKNVFSTVIMRFLWRKIGKISNMVSKLNIATSYTKFCMISMALYYGETTISMVGKPVNLRLISLVLIVNQLAH